MAVVKNIAGLTDQGGLFDPSTWGLAVQPLDNSAEVQSISGDDLASLLSAPSWDDTLTVGNSTSQPYESIADSDNWFERYITPDDYNGADQNRFSSWIDSNFVNGVSGRKDVVFGWLSYNSTNLGGVLVPGEAACWYKIETFFEQASNQMEFHMPEMSATNGNNARLFSIYANRDDATSFANFCIDGFNYISVFDVNQAWASLAHGYAIGTVEMTMDATLGSGGVLGDNSNYARITMVDGYGYTHQIIAFGGFMQLAAPGSIDLTTAAVYGPSFWQFSLADSFADQNVWFAAYSTGVPGKGYYFADYGAGNIYLTVTLGAIVPYEAVYLYQAVNHPGDAEAPFNVYSGSDPTDTTPIGYMQIWNDGTNWFTYVGGVKKTFVLV